MPTATSDIEIRFIGVGSRAIEQDVARLEAAFLKLKATTSDLNTAKLATDLGSTSTNSKKLGTELGATEGKAARAARTLRNLADVGGRLEGGFTRLGNETGFTQKKFQELEGDVGALAQRFAISDFSFDGGLRSANEFSEALRTVSDQLIASGEKYNNFSEQALTAARAFDDAKAKVGTLSDESDAFAASTRQLAADLEFQASSTELLNSSYDVLSSGFSEVAEVNQILEAATLGAVGGFSDINTVADATTTILNSYKLEAEDAAKVVDILAQTQDLGKITIDEFAATIGRAASIAATAGVSFEEFSAAIATATAQGVPAESAVSGTRQAIVNLLKPTADAQKLLQEFGISNSSAALKSMGLVGILETLRDQGATSDQLARIFSDVDALATVSTLAGENIGTFVDNIDAMNESNGKAAESARVVAASFSGQVTAAFNQANEALVSLGNGVKAAAVPLLKVLTFLVSNFNKLPEVIKGTIGAAIALTGGALTLAGALIAFSAVIPAAIGLLGKLALSAVLASAGIIRLTVSLVRLAAGLALMLPLAVAVAAGLAAISFANFAKELREANVEIEDVANTLNSTADSALSAANRTKALITELTQAKQRSGELTASEISSAQKLVAANKLRLDQLKEDLELAKALPAVNEEQRNSRENLIAQTERTIAALSNQNAGLEELIGTTNSSTDANAENALSAEEQAAAYKESVAEIEAAYSELQRQILQTEADSLLEAASMQSGSDEARLAATETRIESELEAERGKLRALQDLGRQALPEDESSRQEAIAASRLKATQLETQQVESALKDQQEARERALDREVEAREAANDRIQAQAERAGDAIAAAELQRAIATQQLINTGVLSQEEADRQRLQSTTARIAAEFEIERNRLAALQALPQSTDSGDRAEAEDDVRASFERLGQLQLEALQNEAALQKALRDEAIAAIEDRAEAAQIASGRVVSGLEQERAAIDAITSSLDSQSRLFEAQQGLQSALSSARIGASERQVGSLNRALEIQQQLSQEEGNSAEVSRALEAELGALGFARGSSELEILRQRQEAEDRLATQQFALLQQNQVNAIRQLEIESQRNDLIAQRLILESRIAEVQAQQGVVAAQATLEAAQVEGDAGAIAQAQAAVDLATQQATLAGESTALATAQLAANEELSALALETLEAEQASAIAQQQATESAREFAQALALAEASSAGIASNLSRSRGGEIPARRMGGTVERFQPYWVGEAGKEIFVPKVPGYVLNHQVSERIVKESYRQFLVPNWGQNGDSWTQKSPRSESQVGTTGDKMGTVGSDVVKSIEGLRRDMKSHLKVPATQNFHFEEEGDRSFERMLRLVRASR